MFRAVRIGCTRNKAARFNPLKKWVFRACLWIRIGATFFLVSTVSVSSVYVRCCFCCAMPPFRLWSRALATHNYQAKPLTHTYMHTHRQMTDSWKGSQKQFCARKMEHPEADWSQKSTMIKHQTNMLRFKSSKSHLIDQMWMANIILIRHDDKTLLFHTKLAHLNLTGLPMLCGLRAGIDYSCLCFEKKLFTFSPSLGCKFVVVNSTEAPSAGWICWTVCTEYVSCCKCRAKLEILNAGRLNINCHIINTYNSLCTSIDGTQQT